MPPLPPHQHIPRIITYYQTHHDPAGKHISVLPLLTQPGIGLTHLVLAAIHINEDPAGLTLNDHAPSHPRFDTLWAELRVLQASGIQVLGMLGGAAKGSYTRLDQDEATFERYYAPLAALVRDRGLDGLDLDVEEPMTLAGIVRLVDRLRADFGQSFVITFAPVAAALLSAEHNLSGFDYEALEVMRGKQISWYNAQFYCGWGDCSNPLMYEMVLRRGWDPERVVVGVVTNPENGSGFVPWNALATVLPVLVGRHPRFGGVMGWEYFNSLPGGRENPWQWAQWMTSLLRGRTTTTAAAATNAVVPAASVVGASAAGAGAGVTATQQSATQSGMVEVDPDEGEEGDETSVPVPRPFEYLTDDE